MIQIYRRFDKAVSSLEPNWRLFLVIYLITAFALFRASVYVNLINREELNTTWHAAMISGTASAPLQYRVLSFLFPEFFIKMLQVTPFTAYMIVRFLCVIVTIPLFHLYLRKWFDPIYSLVGTMFLSVGFLLAQMHVLQPSSPLNFVVFLLGFWAIRSKRDLLLGIIIALGSFNRFTPIFLVVAYLCVNYKLISRRELLLKSIIYLVIWGSIMLGLRLYYHFPQSSFSFVTIEYNLEEALVPFRDPSLFNALNNSFIALLLFGPLWFFSFNDLEKKPAFLSRGMMVVIPFILLHTFFALIYEVRLLLPLAPVIIPSGLLTLKAKIKKG